MQNKLCLKRNNMRTKYILFILCLSCCTGLTAQDNYATSLIPAELLTHSNVVKRMEEFKVQINDVSNAIVYHKYALTILNAAGDGAAHLVENYDRLISIHSIDGKLFDANGKKIRSLKNSDVKDVSGTSDNNLADDNRLKMHNFNYTIYPYTIEYETAIELKGIFYLPAWIPVENENYSVEKSKLVVECPLNYKLRFKTYNYATEPTIITGKKEMVYEWVVEKIPSFEQEKYQPEWYKITPAVFLAPTDFELQQFAGNMSDWKGFGKFIYTLNAGRNKLPANIILQVHTLTDNAGSEKEKIKILYEFMQKNTHYISVQLGIGGWQTFDANYVASNGYGDCKALSNYMFSLLNEIGIKAYYTLIKAGENNHSLRADFPSNQFNHIIVCVPQVKDTIWLECTSQTSPMGYLGSFTCNRDALMIDETGGKLVHTPVYKKNDNLQTRKITGTINEEGKLLANITTRYGAEQQDYLQGMIDAVSKERLTEILKTRLDIPSYDIINFSYRQERTALPVLTEMLEITANNYGTISGKRLFVKPNILNISSAKITNANNRKFEINLPAGFIDIDSVEINIPAGYKEESMPDNVTADTKYGSYSAVYKMSAGKIIYIRTLQRNTGNYPAKEAVAIEAFFEKIYYADRSKIVFIKEELK